MSSSIIVVVLMMIPGIFLAFTNGANDNFKGVATLYGSETLSYKMALAWATITTLLGAIAATFFAEKLLHSFSGKGLVPAEIISLSSFGISIALSAALTVLLATLFGFPISTTHALTGALLGVGYIASPQGMDLSNLYSSFLAPLLVSPIMAIIGAGLLYPLFSFLRKKSQITRESCLCLGNQVVSVQPELTAGAQVNAVISSPSFPMLQVGTQMSCKEQYQGHFFGINAKALIDTVHFLSSGLVSFARGLNDAPKIAALLLIGHSLSKEVSVATIGIAMALGGILMARKVAETMSHQITSMNDGQALSANLVTSVIVLGASRLGLPVSTTHVSCGALFGIGAVTKKAHWNSIFKIFLSWVITLPIAALLGLVFFSLLNGRIS